MAMASCSASMAARRALFKKSPAKDEKKIRFSSARPTPEAFIEGRLESVMLKKHLTGRYSILVCVFTDEDGIAMKLSATGAKADRFAATIEVTVF